MTIKINNSHKSIDIVQGWKYVINFQFFKEELFL